MNVSQQSDSRMRIDATRWGLPPEALDTLGRELYGIWERYHSCFKTRTRDTSELAHVYLKGLLLMLKNRNYANIARNVLDPDDDGQSLQNFMSDSPWDAQRVFAQIQEEIRLDPELSGGILSLDESGDKRSGELSAGAGRQYLGSLGKVEVGQVGVALSYSCPGFWAMVDAELYFPENWFDADHAKLRKRLHVPEDRCFATKPEIGLDLVLQARERGLPFEVVTADSVYGRDSVLRTELNKKEILYILDVPSDYLVYTEKPEVGVPQAKSEKGRPPSKQQVLNEVQAVQVSSLVSGKTDWQEVRLRQAERGEVVVKGWARRVWTISSDWEVRQEWLVVHRQSNDKQQYSLSNADEKTPLQTMLTWRGQRYFVERTFQDSKSELGWDELVAQKYRAWMHHTVLDALALFFIMGIRRKWAQKYPRAEVLKEEYQIEKLPELSVANIRLLLQAVIPLRRFTPEEALRVVLRHLRNRARSTRTRARQQRERQHAHARLDPSPVSAHEK